MSVDCLGNTMCFNVFCADEDAIAGTETDDDAWHAEKERLDPVLHEFAVEILHIARVANLG